LGSDKRNRYLKKRKQKTKKNQAFASFPDLLLHLPKMSEMLIELAEPLLELAKKAKPKDSQNAEDLAFSLAVVAWNISIDPSLEPPTEFDSIQEFDDLLNLLIERKKELFPFDNRLISGFSFQENHGQRLLTVQSVFS
jgi:hypothetical protein